MTITSDTPGYGVYYAKEYSGGPTKRWVACDCLVQWLPALNRLLTFKGLITQPLFIFQLTGSEPESAGTHSQGGAFDLGHWTNAIVAECREMGAPATWTRLKPRFSSNHIHGVLSNCPHNEPARYQIKEQLAGGDGLIGTLPDPHPDPKVYRTWQQGVAYSAGIISPSSFQIRLLKKGTTDPEVNKFQKWLWSKQPTTYKTWFKANVHNFDTLGFTNYYGRATARMVTDTYKRLHTQYPTEGWNSGVVNNVWPDEPGPAFIKRFDGKVYV